MEEEKNDQPMGVNTDTPNASLHSYGLNDRQLESVLAWRLQTNRGRSRSDLLLDLETWVQLNGSGI